MNIVQNKSLAHIFLFPLLYANNKELISEHHRNIADCYIDKDEDILVCVNSLNKAILRLKIEAKYQSHIKLWLDGRYSKFEPYSKLLILKYWYGDEHIKSILFKTDLILNWWKDTYKIRTIKRDQEYWIKPNYKL